MGDPSTTCPTPVLKFDDDKIGIDIGDCDGDDNGDGDGDGDDNDDGDGDSDGDDNEVVGVSELLLMASDPWLMVALHPFIGLLYPSITIVGPTLLSGAAVHGPNAILLLLLAIDTYHQ